MTTELEKQFFDTFGIEPIDYKGCSWGGYCPHEEHIDCGECSYWETWKVDYPQITDRILLELFDILRKHYNLDFWTIDNSFVMDVRDKGARYTNVLYRTGGDLKTSILNSLNLVVKENFIGNDTIKQQVQALFKEG